MPMRLSTMPTLNEEKATLIDLAEDGMAVLFGKKLPPTSKVYFQFQLPGQKSSIRLSGQVIWQDWNGRAGVQFVDVPKTSRRLLTEYLEREPHQRNAAGVAGCHCGDGRAAADRRACIL